jgi:hypothetical protein
MREENQIISYLMAMRRFPREWVGKSRLGFPKICHNVARFASYFFIKVKKNENLRDVNDHKRRVT